VSQYFQCPYCTAEYMTSEAFRTHIRKHKWYEVLGKLFFGWKRQRKG
jgi:hypothetical protein